MIADIKKIIPGKDQQLFPAIETLSVVLPTYLKCSGLSKKNYKHLANQLINVLFSKQNISSTNIALIAEDYLKKVANYVKSHNKGKNYRGFNYGYSVFTINLVLKKFSYLITNSDRNKLDAPLNRNELKQIKAHVIKNGKNVGIKAIGDISGPSIYLEVIAQAKKYAASKGFKSLYEWELNYWNNN